MLHSAGAQGTEGQVSGVHPLKTDWGYITLITFSICDYAEMFPTVIFNDISLDICYESTCWNVDVPKTDPSHASSTWQDAASVKAAFSLGPSLLVRRERWCMQNIMMSQRTCNIVAFEDISLRYFREATSTNTVYKQQTETFKESQFRV